ncbi:replication endonuclease [Shewanella sp. WXL01]|uniref:replication endonuclease n=1 Tax=Shewanella sp. WXL01 TaxID=2709721 RepID=UPI0014386AEB|nr:replication endonuclease [Shewanella sp. WXL01]NKF50188.1 replication endonuclease [Shewanella sp. WXL01]
MPEVHPHDADWVKSRLLGLPQIHKNAVMNNYQKQPNRREANTYIRHIAKAISKVLGHRSSMYCVSIEDSNYQIRANNHARQCTIIEARFNSVSLFKAYSAIVRYVTTYQLTPHPLSEEVLSNLKNDCLSQEELIKVLGVIKRACDASWWKPKLRRLHNKQIETVSRLLNLVNKHRGIYASNTTVENYIAQWKSNRELLENTLATNELDYSVSLAELSDLNVSNPKIRKAELMVRIRGFEEYSLEMGYEAVFLTMTTPSKYHRSFAKSGAENPKWQGATPLDGQHYLNRTFQRIRASLNRNKITPFGFRVAEPHHDGTPHWHLLLFVPEEQQEKLVQIFEEYCLQEDGDEQGAKESRFKVEYIDSSKGSATGYIAKYVAKGVDGEGVEHDLYGNDSITAAIRIRVWASCWGIRQFQQIGGVGVTQWRELRRLDKITDQGLQWIEDVRQAADESNWCRYTELMGGVFCKREDQLIRPLYAFKQQRSNSEHSSQSRDIAREETFEQSNATQEDCIPHPRIAAINTEITEFNSVNIPKNPENNPEINPAMTKLDSGIETENPAIFKESSTSRLVDSGELTEPLKMNKYGDELITQLKGIVCLGFEIITRVHEWTLSYSMADDENALTWSTVNKCTESADTTFNHLY